MLVLKAKAAMSEAMGVILKLVQYHSKTLTHFAKTPSCFLCFLCKDGHMNTRESTIESLRISRCFHLGLVPFLDSKGFASGFSFSWRTQLCSRVTYFSFFVGLGFEGGFLFSFFTLLSCFWWIFQGEFEMVLEGCLVTRKWGYFQELGG